VGSKENLFRRPGATGWCLRHASVGGGGKRRHRAGGLANGGSVNPAFANLLPSCRRHGVLTLV